MDPTATLTALLEALQDQDREAALDALEALTHWLSTGGFLPEPWRYDLGCTGDLLPEEVGR